MTASAEQKHPNYMLIWAYLAILTIVEVVVALARFLPERGLMLVLIILAIWKALLVAAYFMHLKFEPRRLVVMVLVPFPLAVILVTFVMREHFR